MSHAMDATQLAYLRAHCKRGPEARVTGETVLELLDALEAAQAELAAVRGGKVVIPRIPTWEECEEKVVRREKRTALEKFVQDHDWHKTDTRFRDGLEAVFAELRDHAVAAVPEGKILVDAGELNLFRELEMWYRGTTMPSGDMNSTCRRLDAMRASQRPGQGGEAGGGAG